MTPLKPLENRRVIGVASTRYPLNKVCAHPECKREATDAHHAFPRSQITNDSWFVRVEEDYATGTGIYSNPTGDPIPHVTGLCREHHEAVEAHRAWIKLGDGVWVWYDRQPYETMPETDGRDWFSLNEDADGSWWKLLGPLNPQPGSVEGKPKRERYKGIAPRKRVVFSFKVPKDEAENGHEILTALIDAAKEDLGREDQPTYYTLVEVLHAFLTAPKEREDENPGSDDGNTD